MKVKFVNHQSSHGNYYLWPQSYTELKNYTDITAWLETRSSPVFCSQVWRCYNMLD